MSLNTHAVSKQKGLVKLFMFIAMTVAVSTSAEAQNYSSSGQNWSGGWGFSSVSDRSLAMQQAQAIRAARSQPGPTTVVTNYSTNTYDNRSSYQEVFGETLTFDTIDFQLNGDRIGQNTNSVGSMNTGTTNIDITGTNNSVVATNSADNQGCVDGSAQQESNILDSMVSSMGIDVGFNSTGRLTKCAP
jgi:hypothetical protein